jgi:hypothetical protein
VTAINALQISKDSVAKLYLAEARGMRAFYNMLMLDAFVVAFSKEDLGDVSTIFRGEKAVEYIKSELLVVEPVLERVVGPGRLTKAGAWGILTRLHLNAAAYRDIYATQYTFKPEDMDKVIEYSEKIINSGQYSLSPDY